MDYTILMLIVMVAIMYFLMIRPENKRKKKAQEMRESLKQGDVITSIGGIIGKIVSVNKDTIVIETSDDRVRMELADSDYQDFMNGSAEACCAFQGEFMQQYSWAESAVYALQERKALLLAGKTAEGKPD